MPLAGTRTRWRGAGEAETAAAPLPGPAGVGGGTPLLERLLAGRGVTEAGAVERFLSPKLRHLADPRELPGCADAAEVLVAAGRAGRPIVVYGDYDVDGVTAAAILWHTLRGLGFHVGTYVPHRIDEGYGLNADALRAFADEARAAGTEPPLVVTVDCGITAVDEAALARELGLGLIITDHHQFGDTLPEADAVVHPGLGTWGVGDLGTLEKPSHAHGNASVDPSPQVPTCLSPHPDPCGAGVALKLAWQAARVYHGSDRLPDPLRTLMVDLLALAALGTVADVVPLVGENRVITAFGLSRIKATPFVGLNALIDASRLRDDTIDAYKVGFVLGPKLNACGRMGHAREAVKLLTDATAAEAAELSKFLTGENDRRRATERAILDRAQAMVIERGDDAPDRRAIVLAHADWHPGVVGIVASRLVERFHRPTVLLAVDEATNTAKGSARSVDAVDLHAALTACGTHLMKFGGHAMAAGLTLDIACLDAFRDALVEHVNQQLAPEDLAAVVQVDAELNLPDCCLPVFRQVQRLEPFGRDNPRPRLLLRSVTLARPAQRMGAHGKHLSLQLRGDELHRPGRGLRLRRPRRRPARWRHRRPGLRAQAQHLARQHRRRAARHRPAVGAPGSRGCQPADYAVTDAANPADGLTSAATRCEARTVESSDGSGRASFGSDRERPGGTRRAAVHQGHAADGPAGADDPFHAENA